MPAHLTSTEQNEALLHFKNLLRIDSRNPGKQEVEAASYIRRALEQDGIASQTVEASPARPNVFANLPGSSSEKSLLLCAHMDTVPFDETKWRHHPLSAHEDATDGCIYGRGAIDMKHHLAYALATLLIIKRRKSSIVHTLKFAAFADEEQGCTYGSKYIVEQHPEFVQATYGLNEVGGFPIYFGKKKYFAIGVEEKGFAWVKITLRGEPGHGSIPTPSNLILAIGDLVSRIRASDRTIYLPYAVRGFLDGIAASQPFPTSAVLRLLKIPFLTSPLINSLIPAEKRPSMQAMFHNTYNPTIVEAKTSLNVVPGELTLCLDCRIAPGSNIQSVLATIRSAVGGQGSVELLRGEEPLLWDGEHELLHCVQRHLVKAAPDCGVVPLLSLGFTDNSQLRKLGNKMLGFTPMDFPPELDFGKLFHGHNERLPKAGFQWGFALFFDLVADFLGVQ